MEMSYLQRLACRRLRSMEHANDNDTIPRQQAVNDLFDAQGEGILHGLYAQKLLVARHLVDRACTARGRDFGTIETIHFSQPDDEQHDYLMGVFHDKDTVTAFESVAEFHNLTVHFWNAIALEYIMGSSDARDHDIDECRGELATALLELGGVGSHLTDELIRRNETQIRKAIQGVTPDYKAIRSY